MAVVVNDGLSDCGTEFAHALRQPLRDAATVKRRSATPDRFICDCQWSVVSALS